MFALFSASDVVSVSVSHRIALRLVVQLCSLLPLLDIPCVAQVLCLGGVALEGAPSLFRRSRSWLCITSFP